MTPEAHFSLDTGPGHDVAEWEEAAAAVLRKAGRMAAEEPAAAVWDRLARTTLDGITVPPLGTPALLDGLATTGRPSRTGGWDVRAHLAVADVRADNAAALADLEGGVTSLWLDLAPDTDVAAVLDGVLLDLAPVVLDAPGWTYRAGVALLRQVAAAEVAPAPGTNLGADPVGAGVRGLDDSDDLATVARLARDAGVRGVVVDATAVHDLGASDGQELGYSIAVGAAYLRELTNAGIDLEDALGLLEFRYAATDEQFPTIAKLRAARRLWARVVELSGGAQTHQPQHAVTSRPMMSAYDPWVNLLRATVAAFAAGVGGADAVTVLPFDSPLGRPDAFGRRIARNTSALLVAESHVAAVADPAGGAYAVEKLTDDLAAAGWAELQRIEESGGVRAALDDGSLRARIEEVAARRDADVARRRRPLTGLSEFPHLGETRPEREPDPRARPVRRYGAGFEALRDDPVDRAVFLATMGPVAAHTARASFATNLFAAGGIAVEPAGVTRETADVVAAYSGQAVACLAGTDAAYADWGAELVTALREAGARHVIVAGRAEVGADDACAVGVDALAFLTRTREVLR